MNVRKFVKDYCKATDALAFSDYQGIVYESGWQLSGIFYESIKSNMRIWQFYMPTVFPNEDIALSFSEEKYFIDKKDINALRGVTEEVLSTSKRKSQEFNWKKMIQNSDTYELKATLCIYELIYESSRKCIYKLDRYIDKNCSNDVIFPWWIDALNLFSEFQKSAENTRAFLEKRSSEYKSRMMRLV